MCFAYGFGSVVCVMSCDTFCVGCLCVSCDVWFCELCVLYSVCSVDVVCAMVFVCIVSSTYVPSRVWCVYCVCCVACFCVACV